MKRVLIGFVVLVAALAVVLYVELKHQQLASSGPAGGSGTIEGTEVDIVARIPGTIEEIQAAEGDDVKKGALLVRLDCKDELAAQQQAASAVAAANSAVLAAQVGVALAQDGVFAAHKQTAAALAAAKVASVEPKPLEVQQELADRAAARVAKLHDSGGASEQELDKTETAARSAAQQLQVLEAGAAAAQAKAAAVQVGESAAGLQVKLARARLEAAEKQAAEAAAAKERADVAVGYCDLTAPRDAIVSVRNYEPGEVVMPGARILTLIDIRQVKATFYVPNDELAAAAPGKTVDVVADAYPRRVFHGTIKRVATEAEFTPRNVQTREDRDRLVYAVEVRIDNPKRLLRPGMPVEITIPNRGKD